MPGSDDTLRILTQVEVAGIQAGMAESAAAVETHTQAMKASFEELREATDYSVTEARHAFHGLGEEIGIHVPRFVQSFVAQLGGVGPVLAAAFTPIAVIGLVEVLGEIPKKLEEGIGYLHGWNEEAKKDFKEATDAAVEFEHHEIKLNEEIAKIGLIGLKGPEKYAAELKIVGSTTAELLALQNDLEKKLVAVSAEKGYLENTASWWRLLQGTEAATTALAQRFSGAGEQIEKDKIQTEAWVATLKQVTEEIEKRQKLELPTLTAEGAVAAKEAAKEKARAEEQAAKEAERAWHAQVLAEIRDAERAANEKTRILAEEAKANAQFNKNVDAEIKALDKEIARTEEEALHRAIEIQNKEMRERERILQKEVEEERQAFNRITNDVNKGVISWINGQETFGRAAQKVFVGLADDAISNVLKIGEKWVAEHVVMAAMSKLFHIQDQAAWLAAVTAKIAAMKTLGAAQIGLAGSGGVASMAAAPFPIDTTAPEFGASMSAAAAGFLAFEKGGIVPGDMIGMLHAREMVLPAHIAQPLQQAASQGTLGGGGHTFNYTYNGSGSRAEGQLSHKDFMRVVKRELRRRGLRGID